MGRDKRVLSRVRTRSKEARFALSQNVRSLPCRNCAAATRQISTVDPLLPFKIVSVNGRDAPRSGHSENKLRTGRFDPEQLWASPAPAHRPRNTGSRFSTKARLASR